MHTGVKPYHCTNCHKAFLQKNKASNAFEDIYWGKIISI